MGTAFGWLGEIFDTLLSLFPQIVLVRSTHEGVKFKAGRRVRVLKSDNGCYMPFLGWYKWVPYPHFSRSGIHLFWPLVTECEIVPIKRQTTNLAEQYLSTQDGETVGVSGIVVYEVNNVEKLLVDCYDYEDTIQDLALAAIKKVITFHTLDDLRQKSETIDKELTKELRKDLSRFGIKTIKVTLSDLAPCFMIGHWGSAVSVDYGE